MNPRLRAATLLFFASVVFQLSFIFLDAFLSDEGIVLVAADDLAKGKLLYRDLFTPATPAVYLLQGIAFKLLGSSFVLSRILMCILYAGSVVSVFMIATRLLPLRWAGVAGALAIPLQVWIWPHAHYFSYNALAIFFCLLAAQRALALEESPERRWSALSLGIVLAAGIWTKPNLALATGAGVFVYWLLAWGRTVIGQEIVRPRDMRVLLHDSSIVLAGLALGSAPFLVYLAATGTLDSMIWSVLALARIYGDVPAGLFPALFPLTDQIDAVRINTDLVVPGMIGNAMASSLAYRELVSFSGWVDLGVRLIYYAPIALFSFVALSLGSSLRRSRWTEQQEAALLTFSISVLLYMTIVPHPAMHYVIPTLLPALALATFLVHGWIHGSSRLASVAAAGFSIVLISVYLFASLGALHAYISQPRDSVHTARGTVWVEPGTARAWNAILEHSTYEVSQEEQVFAVPHFPMFYFLSARDHPNPYVDLRPGSPGVGAEDAMIQQLERDEVAWVLRLEGSQFHRLERFEVAYPRLDHYITDHYEVARTINDSFGVYARFLRRKSDS